MAGKSTHYPHRRNEDGSYDSICTACYATVASSWPEEALAEFESAHTCDSTLLPERGALGRARSNLNRAQSRAV
jgi:hypothetical protein